MRKTLLSRTLAILAAVALVSGVAYAIYVFMKPLEGFKTDELVCDPAAAKLAQTYYESSSNLGKKYTMTPTKIKKVENANQCDVAYNFLKKEGAIAAFPPQGRDYRRFDYAKNKDGAWEVTSIGANRSGKEALDESATVL
jgi:hypothetical protein